MRSLPPRDDEILGTTTVGVPRRAFLTVQLAGWALLTLALGIPNYFRHGSLSVRLLPWAICFGGGGLLLSTLIGLAYEKVRDRDPRGIWLATVLGCCTLGGLAWLLLLVGCEHLLGSPPWGEELPAGRRHLIIFVRSTLILGTWSAVFLVALLLRRVRLAREHATRVQALAQQAQLQLLRAQLNPHFLFNALNSVVALVDENRFRAKQMVRDLATLLRRALDEGRNEGTTVGDEIDFVRLYLRCEEVRYEDSLDLSLQIDDEVLQRPLPSMLLLPLVENAIKHGMHTSKPPLRVRVAGKLEGDTVILEVANTGKLRKPSTSVIGTGLGLRNISERLEALFPGRHSFELSDDEGWVTARLQYQPPEVAT